jgi:hypothetical protein
VANLAQRAVVDHFSKAQIGLPLNWNVSCSKLNFFDDDAKISGDFFDEAAALDLIEHARQVGFPVQFRLEPLGKSLISGPSSRE